MALLQDILRKWRSGDLRGTFTLVFDCYGTLIDWIGGLRSAFKSEFPGASNELSEKFLALWMERDLSNASRSERASYREILISNTKYALDSLNIGYNEDQLMRIALSIYRWEPFPDVITPLGQLKLMGFKLAIMSNTDPQFLRVSASKLGVEFDHLIACSELGYFKPNPQAWLEAMRRYRIPRESWIHLSSYPEYDLIPARKLGLHTVLLNRYNRDFQADLVISSLDDLVRLTN